MDFSKCGRSLKVVEPCIGPAFAKSTVIEAYSFFDGALL